MDGKMIELSTETNILYNKTIIRGRNLLVQRVRGRNVRERNVHVQKVPWRNILGAKRPGPKRPACPKSPVTKRPWCETSRSKTSGGRNILVLNLRGQNVQVQNIFVSWCLCPLTWLRYEPMLHTKNLPAWFSESVWQVHGFTWLIKVDWLWSWSSAFMFILVTVCKKMCIWLCYASLSAFGNPNNWVIYRYRVWVTGSC